MMIDYKALAAPFEFEDLEWRVLSVRKSGDKFQSMITPYVTNRAIQDRLDKVCHPKLWRNEYLKWDGGQLCGITITDGDRDVTKWDGAENTDIEPLKGGLSNSMKRAAVQWGIGRYLYYLPPMKGQQINWKPGAIRGDYYDKKTKEREVLWWTPNAAAVKAIKEASK